MCPTDTCTKQETPPFSFPGTPKLHLPPNRVDEGLFPPHRLRHGPPANFGFGKGVCMYGWNRVRPRGRESLTDEAHNHHCSSTP